ncbi:MAG: hypothetical protein FJW31_05525 [Acidobacteria bacterium]|nr:hypothetical protein [Acidobacteriota bacterium]
MLRRTFTTSLAAFVGQAYATNGSQSIRGKLAPGPKPTLLTPAGPITLTGDAGTLFVLGDLRLKDLDVELLGQPASAEPGAPFQIQPLHKRAVFVYKAGKRLMVTYWCEVCSIRTFTPGVCMCCQDETAVDFKERLESDDLSTAK